MKIVVAGASGLIGGALVPELRRSGHEVWRLVRREARSADEITWEPAAGSIDVARIDGADAVVNLSGENVGSGRWTEKRRELILRSRVDATRTLVTALDRMDRKPKVWLNASATGFYGERGDEVLNEASEMGHGFLPEVCLAWETHANGAARRGVRTVLLRFGVVLAKESGALAKMLPFFRLGLGGRMGDGRQWLSWVSLPDVVGAMLHALDHAACSGPLNVVSPTPATNAQFATALGRVLRRPAVLPVPAILLRLAFGQMADETVLGSTRAVPARLIETGYTFRHPTLDGTLRDAINP